MKKVGGVWYSVVFLGLTLGITSEANGQSGLRRRPTVLERSFGKEISSDGYSTARDAYQAALSAARAEDPDAQLVGLVGVEAQRPDQFVEVYRRDHPETATVRPDTAANPTALHDAAILFFSVPSADQNIGDGKASAWVFSFEGLTGVRIVVVKTRGREVTFNRAVPSAAAPPAGRRPTDREAAWQLDSDQMTRAADAIPNFAERRRQSSLAVHVLSMKEGQDPFWNTSLLVGDIGDRDWEWADVLVSMTGAIISPGQLCGRTKDSCH